MFYKPGSVWVLKPGSHLSRMCVAAHLKHATRKQGRDALYVFLFAFASDGVYQATLLPTCWCALTTPFQLFSYLHLLVLSSGSLLFCDTIPSGFPAQSLTGILSLRSPDFPLRLKNFSMFKRLPEHPRAH